MHIQLFPVPVDVCVSECVCVCVCVCAVTDKKESRPRMKESEREASRLFIWTPSLKLETASSTFLPCFQVGFSVQRCECCSGLKQRDFQAELSRIGSDPRCGC